MNFWPTQFGFFFKLNSLSPHKELWLRRVMFSATATARVKENSKLASTLLTKAEESVKVH